ncbi:MAG: hypothetical protein ACTSU2_05980 [Promethearchaeota archaeon]
MNFKTFIMYNSVIIGTIIVVSGYIWMITLCFLPAPSLNQVMISFTYTISGIGFWGISYYSSNSKKKDESGMPINLFGKKLNKNLSPQLSNK